MVVPSVVRRGGPPYRAMSTQMVASKLGVAVIVASIAGAVLWIEHGHRIDIEAPAGAAFAAPIAACPDNENVPYSADCIVFMQGDVASDIRWRVNAAKTMPAASGHAPGGHGIARSGMPPPTTKRAL